MNALELLLALHQAAPRLVAELSLNDRSDHAMLVVTLSDRAKGTSARWSFSTDALASWGTPRALADHLVRMSWRELG